MTTHTNAVRTTEMYEVTCVAQGKIARRLEGEALRMTGLDLFRKLAHSALDVENYRTGEKRVIDFVTAVASNHVAFVEKDEILLLKQLTEAPIVLLNRVDRQYVGIPIIGDAKSFVPWFTSTVGCRLQSCDLQPDGIYGYTWWRVCDTAGEDVRVRLNPEHTVISVEGVEARWEDMVRFVSLRDDDAIEEFEEEAPLDANQVMLKSVVTMMGMMGKMFDKVMESKP